MVEFTMKSNKIISAMAVFALALAGIGIAFTGGADDAVPVADKDIVIKLDGVIVFAEGESAADFAPGVMTVTSELDVAALDDLNVIQYDQYNTYIKPYLKAIGEVTYAVFPAEDFDLVDPTFKNILDVTTAYDKATGDGLETMIVFDMNLKTEALIDAVDAAQAKALAIGIAKAFADVPAGYISEADAAAATAAAVAKAVAAYDDYLSPAEVQAAIAAAIADLSDYIYTQADLDKAVADAIAKTKETYKYTQADLDKAVEEAKASVEPVKIVEKNDMYLYMFIGAIAVAIAFAALFALVFFGVIQPKAKKENDVEEPAEA